MRILLLKGAEKSNINRQTRLWQAFLKTDIKTTYIRGFLKQKLSYNLYI